jgi:hypothetical protein
VVTLLWEVAVLLDIVVALTGVAGAKMAPFSRVRGGIGWGVVGGCVYVIGRLGEARFGDWGQRFNRGLWGRGVGSRGQIVMGISSIEGVSMVGVGVALKIRVTSFIVIGYREVRGFMW